MPEFLIHLILMACGAIFVLAGVLIGGYLMFKSISVAGGGTSFLPQSPKGEAFSIAVPEEGAEFAGAEEPSENEKKILSGVSRFLEAAGIKK